MQYLITANFIMTAMLIGTALYMFSLTVLFLSYTAYIERAFEMSFTSFGVYQLHLCLLILTECIAGLFGSLKYRIKLIHGILFGSLSLLQIILAIFIFTRVQQWNRMVDKLLETAMPELHQLPNAKVHDHVVDVMKDFECCGINHKSDYADLQGWDKPLPEYCCEQFHVYYNCTMTDAYDVGCMRTLRDMYFTIRQKVIFPIGLIVILCFCISCICFIFVYNERTASHFAS